MPKLAANLTLLFTELPFLERFAAAAEAGFRAVEILFPYEFPAATVAELLRSYELELVLINAPPGDVAQGDRGLAALPQRAADFEASLAGALAYAQVCGCPRIHVLAGIPPAELAAGEIARTYTENITKAARLFAPHGIDVLIEPLNAYDNPGYYLRTTSEAIAILDGIGARNAALQLDLYHAQITEGDLERRMRALFGRFGHVQIAGNPHRNEPDRGEVAYAYLLDVLDALGYAGWVGCEYRPAADTRSGLRWARSYLTR